MNNITKSELRKIILSVHAINYDFGANESAFDNTIENLIDEESQHYEVTEYGKKQNKEDVDKLLAKLIELIV